MAASLGLFPSQEERPAPDDGANHIATGSANSAASFNEPPPGKGSDMPEEIQPGAAAPAIDCATDPIGALKTMFVDIVQGGRIRRGQCPVQRPVFLKPHGVAHGRLAVRPDLPAELRIGLLAGREYPAWIRFSSDTASTVADFRTTVGIGIKLFGVPGAKLAGDPGDMTADLIFQNHDRFFVDTAADMCAFTRAGVVDGDYGPYLARHPVTAQILDEMEKPVSSLLAESYWSILPFRFGKQDHVKYRLEPALEAEPVNGRRRTRLSGRRSQGAAFFRAGGLQARDQRRTNPVTMPLDAATIRWDGRGAWLEVADFWSTGRTSRRGVRPNMARISRWIFGGCPRRTGGRLDRRCAAGRLCGVGRAAPQHQRHPIGRADEPRPAMVPPAGRDTRIISAKIHPGIGIARIGDSLDEYYVGPEVTDPANEEPGFYRDAKGAVKRQAARFRLYGYNAAGEVVRELTGADANIIWTAHVANRKASWYRFLAALDIPDAAKMKCPKRNPGVRDRSTLEIDPGPRSITGANVGGGAGHLFDTGKFKSTIVSLGELRTDDEGRLLVLGGRGRSETRPARRFMIGRPGFFNNATTGSTTRPTVPLPLRWPSPAARSR